MSVTRGARASTPAARSTTSCIRFAGSARTGESLSAQRLELIAGVRERLTIAMAYLGDPAPTEAVVAPSSAASQVTLLTAARANVGGDINLHMCAEILHRTGGPQNLRLVLHPSMVHGKVIVGDGEWVDLGSTNFTRLSHGGYEEVDVFCRDRMFARRVEQAIETELRAGVPGRLPLDYRRWRLFRAPSAPFRDARRRASDFAERPRASAFARKTAR